MSTFIRVKRRLLEDPLEDTIVLNIKRQKTDEDSSTNSAIFTFASTIDQATNFNEHIQKLSKDDAINIIDRKKKPTEGNLNKRIEQNREKRILNRLTIVNLSRGHTCETSSASGLTILDVEKNKEGDQKASSTSEISAADSGAFVYDIYIQDSKKDSPDDFNDLNDLSIMEYNDYLYSCSRLNNDESDDDLDPEDSDSNDEDHWKNDYPDEDTSDNESIDERIMRKAITNLDIGNELSSDDDFVCSADEESANRYGTSYAIYKKRVLKEFQDSSDEDEN